MEKKSHYKNIKSREAQSFDTVKNRPILAVMPEKVSLHKLCQAKMTLNQGKKTKLYLSTNIPGLQHSHF